LRTQTQYTAFRARLFALAILSFVGCQADTPQTGAAEQAVINPPLPSNLNLALNARTTVTIGPFARAFGDVASSGPTGSLLFDVNSTQDSGQFNALANTVTVRAGASADHVFGNDIMIEGSVSQESLGLDPGALPQVPAATAITPGTTNVIVKPNEAKQLCPGQFGAISLGIGATLNLNGGVYQITRLTLADGARLEPSEPVVILVSTTMTTGVNSALRPSAQAINPMTAGDIRIETGGTITLGDGTQVRAHLLAPNSKLITGQNVNMTGAGWAKSISIGSNSFVNTEGVLSLIAPTVPPPCNDNSPCTVDRCVTSGGVARCANTPVPSGSSCEDSNVCNGAEVCSATGQCLPGTPLSAGTSCGDGNACNGDETCNGIGTCVPGTPPVVSDGNPCTVDACDTETGASHIPLPDGTVCANSGECSGGVCSIPGVVYSENFVQFAPASAQCDSWKDFVSNQLANRSYNRVTLSGTFNSRGFTCSDPSVATLICGALHRGDFVNGLFCGTRFWFVNQCGGAPEINLDGAICSCTSGGADIRPCSGSSWGGVSTETCDAPSQNLSVVCE
jgi:hypothetical protein